MSSPSVTGGSSAPSRCQGRLIWCSRTLTSCSCSSKAFWFNFFAISSALLFLHCDVPVSDRRGAVAGMQRRASFVEGARVVHWCSPGIPASCFDSCLNALFMAASGASDCTQPPNISGNEVDCRRSRPSEDCCGIKRASRVNGAGDVTLWPPKKCTCTGTRPTAFWNWLGQRVFPCSPFKIGANYSVYIYLGTQAREI